MLGAGAPQFGGTMSRFVLTLMAGLLSIVLSASIAQAHSHLKASDPAADSTVAASPAAIHLTFSMPIVAKFSGIRLVDGTGKEIPVGEATIDPQDSKQLIVPVQSQLSPGDYTVEWHVVAVDSHRMTGSYKFRIGQ